MTRTDCQRDHLMAGRVCTLRSTWRFQAVRAAQEATCHHLVELLLPGRQTAQRSVSASQSFCPSLSFRRVFQFVPPSVSSGYFCFRLRHNLLGCSDIERAPSQRDPQSLNEGAIALSLRAKKMQLKTRELVSGLVNSCNFSFSSSSFLKLSFSSWS